MMQMKWLYDTTYIQGSRDASNHVIQTVMGYLGKKTGEQKISKYTLGFLGKCRSALESSYLKKETIFEEKKR